MDKIKVLSIFGTRPEAIKMAPIIKEMEKNALIHSEVLVTGQHRQMLDQVLEIFDITPNYDLNIMSQRQTLTTITTSSLTGIEKILIETEPDIILVHGDTTTTFAGALAGFYTKIKVGHVEAGLRTHNKYEPFPEEINRKLTGVIADIHFAPTVLSKQNLLKENVEESSIFVTGNTSVDSVKYSVKQNYKFKLDKLNTLDYSKKIILLTAHRRENIGKPLEQICQAVLDIVNLNEDVEVIYAVHFNPKVREIVNPMLEFNDKVHLIDPVDMEDMHNLISKSYLVMTDSGGLQEEVPSLKKPVLVLRNVTERPEGVESGVLKLVGTNTENIKTQTQILIDNKNEYDKMINSENPFGDGLASRRIVEFITYFFGKNEKKPQKFK